MTRTQAEEVEAVRLAQAWLDDCVSPNGEDADRVARALLSAHAELARVRAVVEAAREWAESTRVWPPNGDDDALNHLLEVAQDSYNKTLPDTATTARRGDATHDQDGKG